MPSDLYGPNVIEVIGAAMLLTTAGGGVAVHLTAAVDDLGSGRGVVGDFDFDRDRNDRAGVLAGYDRAALTQPRWSEAAWCGGVWAIMVGGDGGAMGRSGEVAFAPACRRCLAILGRYFPRPIADGRLTLVAQFAAHAWLISEASPRSTTCQVTNSTNSAGPFVC